jgi:hypothetical protein
MKRRTTATEPCSKTQRGIDSLHGSYPGLAVAVVDFYQFIEERLMTAVMPAEALGMDLGHRHDCKFGSAGKDGTVNRIRIDPSAPSTKVCFFID